MRDPFHQVELHGVLHAFSILDADANGPALRTKHFLTKLNTVRILLTDPACIGREIASSRGVRADGQDADWG